MVKVLCGTIDANKEPLFLRVYMLTDKIKPPLIIHIPFRHKDEMIQIKFIDLQLPPVNMHADTGFSQNYIFFGQISQPFLQKLHAS